jgi:hypothetical protein
MRPAVVVDAARNPRRLNVVVVAGSDLGVSETTIPKATVVVGRRQTRRRCTDHHIIVEYIMIF